MNEFRIVSLCPSTTYTLYDLGLMDSIVGRTQFCIHPESINHVKKIGGTKNPNLDKIAQLNPTHILFNREENDLAHLTPLSQIADVIESTPITFPEMVQSISDLGDVFEKRRNANQINQQILNQIDIIQNTPFRPFSYLYLIWQNPYMSISHDTFISHTLALFGGENKISISTKSRYPELDLNDIKSSNADVLFLSSEPFPFKEKHIEQFTSLNQHVSLINGEYTSWHGSYMRHGLQKLITYFESLQVHLQKRM